MIVSRYRRIRSALLLAAWLCSGSQAFSRVHDQPLSNWTSPDVPCAKYDDLRNIELGDVGVKLDVDGEWADGVRRALRFWNMVLDANFHEESRLEACSIRIIYAGPEIVSHAQVARSQITEWEHFRGKIAFRRIAAQELSSGEVYAIAVHEIGHMLGLKHNPKARSVMYFLNVDGSEALDVQDIVDLSRRHKMRREVLGKGPFPLEAAVPKEAGRDGF